VSAGHGRRVRRLAAAPLFALLAACGGGGDGGGGGNTPLSITSTAVDDGMIGSDYGDSVVAAGGRGAKTFTITAGALPDGLAMSAGGAISGTPTGPAGESNFTVSVTDSAKAPATDTQAFSINIVEPLEITTATLPDTSVGDAYAASVLATGGAQPLTFIPANGSPPDAIVLNGDGTLSGTVLASATTETFDVQVVDSSSPPFTRTQTYTVRVAMAIATAALEDATGGVAYSDNPAVQGGLPPYDWSLTSGTLPPGLTGPNAVTGEISGTPEPACAASTATLGFSVTDSDSPAVTATRAGITLTVNPATLEVTSAALANGVIGNAYDQSVVASGGVPPYGFAITAGALPSGLAFNGSTGRITGTPDTAETQDFEVTVTDACPNTATRDLSLTVTDAVLGRNDSIDQATVLPGDGTYHASISPSGHPNTEFAPDEDFYRITTTAASDVTVDVNARSFGSPLDSVIEIVDANGVPLNSCVAPAFNSECQHDDDDTDAGELDSFLQVRVAGGTTFYIHVVDWGSNARPDKLYDLVISGVD
jgi:hypothetical protein